MGAHQDGAQLHAETIEQWRTWLVDHHADADGVWLVSWKTATGRTRITQGAWGTWDGFPRSTKRAILVWIRAPKAAATRAKRIAEAAEKAGRGGRAR